MRPYKTNQAPSTTNIAPTKYLTNTDLTASRKNSTSIVFGPTRGYDPPGSRFLGSHLQKEPTPVITTCLCSISIA